LRENLPRKRRRNHDSGTTLLRQSEGPMLFKKLFKLLVVGGAVAGATSGCAARAQGREPGQKNSGTRDGGTAPDAGAKAQDTGGGAQGW
jgi:hypothetical protein